MEARMGNLNRPLQPPQDCTQSRSSHLGTESEEIVPTEDEGSKFAELASDDDPLNAARGAVFGVALGSIIWAVLWWALL
jgi:hypothetical protein